VKSSSLNRAISSSQQNLGRKDVDEILSRLTALKENFVTEAFSRKEEVQVAEKQETAQIEVSEPEKTEEKEEELQEELDNLEHSLEELNTSTQNLDETQQEVLKTEEFEIILENKLLPVLRIQFFKEVDYVLLKYISSLFFESYEAEGSNILVTGSEALIVLRKQGDELFALPRIQCDLEQIYTQLKKEDSNEVEEGEYTEIEEPKEEKIINHKEEDSSLDSLLGSYEEKDAPHDPVESHSPEEQKEEEPELEKVEEVQIEKSKEESLESQGIEKVREEEEVEETYLVYKDNQIKVYVNEESPILGEMIIESVPPKTQEELSESEMSYLFVFSKIFASILFESLEAHGTNIIWERSSSKMRIVPRYQEDGINLQWKGQQHKDSFLEQIKSKIHATLAQGIDPEQIKAQQPSSSQGNGQETQSQNTQSAPMNTGIKSGVPKFEELFTPERIDNTKKEKLEFLKKCIMSMP
jgi:hypothetical protein